MIRAFAEAVHSRRLVGWRALLLACAALAGLNYLAEIGRHHDEIQFAKSRQLNHLLWQEWGDLTADVQSSILTGGKPLELSRTGPETRIAEVKGETIGPQYRGWTIILRFSDGPMSGLHNEALAGGRVIPPPGITPRGEPTAFWWAVEYLRATFMLGGMLAWAAGIVLILIVRRARQQIARWCLAGALVSLFAMTLAWNFHWEWETLTTPGWFNTAAAMAAFALLLRFIPSRRRPIGRCHACRYDLTGNESGVCPECGTPTPRHVRELRLAELAPAADRLVYVEEPVMEIEAEEEGVDPTEVVEDISDPIHT